MLNEVQSRNAGSKDPVCGMDVDKTTAAAKSEHKGETYYFCSAGCKTAFDKEPDKYAGKEKSQEGGHTH